MSFLKKYWKNAAIAGVISLGVVAVVHRVPVVRNFVNGS